MARQPTLAEILADETGRIRPEVADLLMEPPPLRQRPQQGPIPRAQPRPRPAGAPVAPPRYFSPGWILLGLIIFIVILALAIPRDRGQDKEVVAGLNSFQTSKEAGALVSPQKALPLPAMAEEKVENATPNLHDENANSECGSNELRNRIQSEQFGPPTNSEVLQPESFNRRPGDVQVRERRRPPRWKAYAWKPSPENSKRSIRIYVVHPPPNSSARIYPRNYSESRQPYSRSRQQTTYHGPPRPAIVTGGRVLYQGDFYSYQRNLYPYPYVQERIRVPERRYRYYSVVPPRGFY